MIITINIQDTVQTIVMVIAIQIMVLVPEPVSIIISKIN